MSDGGIWRPPDPDAAVPLAEPPAAPSRSRGKIIGAAIGAVAIVGAGTFAVARIAGDDGAGGAATPEDAGLAFLEAVDNEDVLGMVDVMLPGERQALHGPLTELVDELGRLEVLSEDADASAVSGVDFVVENPSVVEEATNVDDIVNVTLRADLTGSIDGEELPVGDWIRDELGDELADLDETDTEEQTTLRLTAVEEDERWYLSMFHTVAESARAEAGEPDIPEEGVTPAGGDSPEAAMDVLLDAVEDLDLEAMIAALEPGEAQALQRYAPLFLDDAQAELDASLEESPLDVSITDRSYTVDGSGDTRTMSLDGVTVELAADGETASMALLDGCWIVTIPDQPDTNTCDDAEEIPALDEMLEEPEAVEELIVEVREAFADYEDPGFVVREVDGSWYLSPIATASEQLLSVLRSLTREEIDGVQSSIEDVVEAFEEMAAEQEVVPLDDESESVDPADACWIESEATTAAACFEALVADGSIVESAVPWYLRYPECGLADLGWSGEYYELADAEFAAIVEDASPCFQELVASRAADELELPVEVLRPECLLGRNSYTATEEDYVDEFEECVFG